MSHTLLTISVFDILFRKLQKKNIVESKSKKNSKKTSDQQRNGKAAPFHSFLCCFLQSFSRHPSISVSGSSGEELFIISCFDFRIEFLHLCPSWLSADPLGDTLYPLNFTSLSRYLPLTRRPLSFPSSTLSSSTQGGGFSSRCFGAFFCIFPFFSLLFHFYSLLLLNMFFLTFLFIFCHCFVFFFR